MTITAGTAAYFVFGLVFTAIGVMFLIGAFNLGIALNGPDAVDETQVSLSLALALAALIGVPGLHFLRKGWRRVKQSAEA